MVTLLTKLVDMIQLKKLLMIPAIGATILGGGAVAGYASMVSAQTATDTTTSAQTTQTSTTQAPQPTHDPTKGGHVGANGVKEELLTGDTAQKVTAAALAAVPGGTIERVETDAEGAAYEAHMTKADGSRVTVKFDTSFNVTGIESGPNRPAQMQTQTQ